MNFCTISKVILSIIVRCTSLLSYFVPSQAVSQITLLPSKFLINLDFTNYPAVTWIVLNCFKVFFCCTFQISFHIICCNDTTIASLIKESLHRNDSQELNFNSSSYTLLGKYVSSRESEVCFKNKNAFKKYIWKAHVAVPVSCLGKNKA